MAIGTFWYFKDGNLCRTPKQKLKFKVSTISLLEKLQQSEFAPILICSLFKDHRKEVKVKEAMQMNYIVSVVRDQIHEMESVPSAYDSDMSDAQSSEMKEKNKDIVLKNKLLQLVAVLQQGGQFRGFNRKIQLRPLQWKEAPQVEDAEQNDDNSDSGNDDIPFVPSNELRTSLDDLGLQESELESPWMRSRAES